MIKEVIIVEGRMDIRAVKRAVDADCIITDGFRLRSRTLNDIRAAYEKRGIIILTDPDSVGERIRNKLTAIFPRAKHAFIPQEEATATDGDIGVEQASPEAIRAALQQLRMQELNAGEEFTMADLVGCGLAGGEAASSRRARLGKKLGIGFANAKTFLKRLNTYGVTREEFLDGVAAIS